VAMEIAVVTSRSASFLERTEVIDVTSVLRRLGVHRIDSGSIRV
jgi:hypothetical protein